MKSKYETCYAYFSLLEGIIRCTHSTLLYNIYCILIFTWKWNLIRSLEKSEASSTASSLSTIQYLIPVVPIPRLSFSRAFCSGLTLFRWHFYTVGSNFPDFERWKMSATSSTPRSPPSLVPLRILAAHLHPCLSEQIPGWIIWATTCFPHLCPGHPLAQLADIGAALSSHWLCWNLTHIKIKKVYM